MSLRPPRPRRALALACGLTATLGGASVILALGSCGDAGVGVDPPEDRLFFPTGILLDPRVPADTPARWLFVTNANSDLVYNAATLTAVDLDAFMAAWQSDDMPEAGAAVDAEHPCRRSAVTPQLIECTEEPFLQDQATVHLGSFTTAVSAWDREPADDELRLFVPVRSDPSIAMVDVRGGLGSGPLEFACGAGSDPDERDPRKCSRESRIKYYRGNPNYTNLDLGREPAKVTVSTREELPVAYITHSEIPQIALVRLTGLIESEIDDGTRPWSPDEPTIVDVKALFDTENALTYGGYGLAERPCAPGNAPALTVTSAGECGRPLMYATYRRRPWVIRFTVDAVTPTADQKCVYAEQLEQGVQGGLLCEEQLVGIDEFFAGGFDVGNSSSGAPVFGDLAFSRDGDSLYIVQTNPGALVRVDTSLDERGGPRDFPSGIVEVCANPTAMLLFDDGSAGAEATGEYAAVSCYAAGMVFVVDLSAFRVVESLSTGSGPHHMVFDRARGYLYVANTLDATISVIDLSPARSTRFTEVARLGLQEPYTG